MTDIKTKCAIIGGGAAGMMAAGAALRGGCEVTIFEATDRLGKKLAITGKGRCNITNNCDIDEFLRNVTKNQRFLYTALNTLNPDGLIELFSSLGVKTKVERGNRVFPESDKAKTVVDALRLYSEKAKKVYAKVK